MREALKQCELFVGMDENTTAGLLDIARQRSLAAGEYLFLLGDHADHLFVVLEGRLEVCFPLTFEGAVRDVAVESKKPGSALGWSALVKPYCFTLSARAAEPSTVAAFARQDLLRVLEADSKVGQTFMARLAEVIGRRLLTIQALWARELQRAVSSGWTGSSSPASQS